MSTCITPTDSKIDSLIFYTAQEKINSICGNSVLFLIWYTITCPVSCINRLALRACSETKLLNSIRSSIDCSSNNISVHTRIVVHIYSYKKKSECRYHSQIFNLWFWILSRDGAIRVLSRVTDLWFWILSLDGFFFNKD